MEAAMTIIETIATTICLAPPLIMVQSPGVLSRGSCQEPSVSSRAARHARRPFVESQEHLEPPTDLGRVRCPHTRQVKRVESGRAVVKKKQIGPAVFRVTRIDAFVLAIV